MQKENQGSEFSEPSSDDSMNLEMATWKKIVAKYVFSETIKALKEIEGLPVPSPKVDKIIVRQINQATKKYS